MNDLDAIKSVVVGLELPEYVKEFDYFLDEDSSGYPAVWVYVIVTDEEADGESFGPDSRRIGNAIEDAIHASGIGRWPYIRFRSLSEVQTPVRG